MRVLQLIFRIFLHEPLKEFKNRDYHNLRVFILLFIHFSDAGAPYLKLYFFRFSNPEIREWRAVRIARVKWDSGIARRPMMPLAKTALAQLVCSGPTVKLVKPVAIICISLMSRFWVENRASLSLGSSQSHKSLFSLAPN